MDKSILLDTIPERPGYNGRENPLTGYSMPKPKGGRGKIAPYRTTHLRVPEPIKDQIQSIIDDYRESLLNQEPIEPSGKEFTQAIAVLREALTLPANTGGKIKVKIREALAILGEP